MNGCLGSSPSGERVSSLWRLRFGCDVSRGEMIGTQELLGESKSRFSTPSPLEGEGRGEGDIVVLRSFHGGAPSEAAT